MRGLKSSLRTLPEPPAQELVAVSPGGDDRPELGCDPSTSLATRSTMHDALETDSIDAVHRRGWSVLARTRH